MNVMLEMEIEMRGNVTNGVFFLHEDEWGMIDIMPIENLTESAQTADKAEEFAKEHFDGFGYTDVFAIPEPKYPLASKRIPLDFIRSLVTPHLAEAEKVECGVRPGEDLSYLGPAPFKSFAFGDNNLGALYGNHLEGVIEYLHLIRPDVRDDANRAFWLSVLTTLGSTHLVMLSDWWTMVSIDLADATAIREYLR
jgi:hypothetical protein